MTSASWGVEGSKAVFKVSRGRIVERVTLFGPVSAGLGRVEAVPAFADGRHDLGDPCVEGVKFFRLGRVGDERTPVT